MKNLILTLDQRRIVKCYINVNLDNSTKKELYKKACLELAQWLMSNNAVAAQSELLLDRPDKGIYFWIQTYKKPIDWDRL